MSLEIQRAGGTSAPPPIQVHVIRIGQNFSADDEGSRFTWSQPPASFTGDAQSESVAFQEGFLLTRSAGWGGPDKIVLAAWNGPQWEGDGVEYELIAEFPGNLLLRSGRQSMQVAY
jgi:hypothetical protein